jgi:hypothetical protein
MSKYYYKPEKMYREDLVEKSMRYNYEKDKEMHLEWEMEKRQIERHSRRMNLKKILADKETKAELIQGVIEFMRNIK